MRLVKIKSRFFSTMLAISILLCSISVAVYHTDALSFVFGAAGFVTAPVQKLASAISSGVTYVAERFSDIDELKRENERLYEENQRLIAQSRDADVIHEENQWLRQFLGLKNQREEITFVDAKIIARDVGFIRTFTMDKGSFHGVEKNMPVITESGLLGVVTEVGVDTCRGISLINHNTSVGVYMERTRTPAVLTGSFELYSNGLCKVVNLPQDADILVGDLVYTSGYGGIYPKDIAVGTIVSIEPNPSNYTISAVVTPAADMTLSDYVMIVTSSETIYE